MTSQTMTEPSDRRRRWQVPAFLLVGTVAFALRLLPVLGGGGLHGRGNYDDGVYFAVAEGLVHGLLPYRDVLLLHPPGIVLALAPFAALAGWLGDPTAFAIARVAFMLLGALNAVLVGVALRRVGLVAALTGGLFYAVFFPVVYVEHTTLLEPLATTCLLGAIAVLGNAERASVVGGTSVVGGASVVGVLPVALAGCLLGFSAGVKIWGVVPAVAVVVWVLISLGRRAALDAVGGFVAGVTLICLPFFAAAPTQMWHLVVVSQLGRPEAASGWAERAWMITGLSPVAHAPVRPWLLVAVVVLAGCCAVSWSSRPGRLCVVVLVSVLGLLFATPTWFLHYAAAAGGPLALVAGTAAGWVAVRVNRPAPALLAGGAALVVLAASAQAVLALPFGTPFPTAALAPAVAAARTCVTTDDPISLIELDMLSRNLDRGCPLLADLGGYSYALQSDPSAAVPRRKNLVWQRLAIAYLRSGDVMVGLRFNRTHGFSDASAATVKTWPVLARSGRVTARHPVGPTPRAPRPPVASGLLR